MKSLSLPLPKPSDKVGFLHEGGIAESMDEFLRDFRDGKVENYAIAYTKNYDIPSDDASRSVCYIWGGEKSSLAVLGLVEYLKSQIYEYIADSE